MNLRFRIANNRLIYLIGIVMVLLPIIIYFYLLNIFAINIPYWDEYDAALFWLDLYIRNNFPTNFFLLFNQHNEHRVFLYYTTVLSQYAIWGKLNFRHIILFGNIGMLGLLFILYKLNQVKRDSLLAFSPVVFLLFVPLHHISAWGMMTISSILQYLLAFASLFFLNKKGNINLAVAVFIAALATFSLGNGMFVFFSGFVILFLKEPKSFKKIFIWAVFMIICISLYLIDFNPSTAPFSKFDVFYHPINGILFLVTIFGNLFSDLSKGHLMLYFVFGFIVLSFFSYLVLCRWNYHRKNPLALSYLVFLLLSAIAATISRFGLGIGAATTPRYVLLPALFVAVMYIVYLNIFHQVKHRVLFLTLAISVVFYSIRLSANYQKINLQKAELSEGILSYYANSDSTTLAFPNPQLAAERIDKAILDGLYTPPTINDLFPDIHLNPDLNIIPPTGNLLFSIDKVSDNDKFVSIQGWAFLKEGNRYDQKIGIVLKSETDSFVFSTLNIQRPDVIEYYKGKYTGIKQDCGFKLYIIKPSLNIPTGEYLIGICLIENGRMRSIRYSDQTISIPAY